MAEEGDVIFDSSVDEWESVDNNDNEDFNDYDLEFVDMDEVEEGDYWIGTYTGTREIGGVMNSIFDNDEDEVSYAFTPHAILKTQLADTNLSKNQRRADNPVEKGETVAIVYQGVYEDSDSANPPHIWDVRRPPE